MSECVEGLSPMLGFSLWPLTFSDPCARTRQERIGPILLGLRDPAL
jgi:hypothetical protein